MYTITFTVDSKGNAHELKLQAPRYGLRHRCLQLTPNKIREFGGKLTSRLFTYVVDYQGESHEFIIPVPPEGISRYLNLTPTRLLELLPKTGSS